MKTNAQYSKNWFYTTLYTMITFKNNKILNVDYSIIKHAGNNKEQFSRWTKKTCEKKFQRGKKLNNDSFLHDWTKVICVQE